MSYTPTIVINKLDLDKVVIQIEEEMWPLQDVESEEYRVLDYLLTASKYDSVKVSGIELVLCSPEFSTFNSLVRNKLKELGVEYGVWC